MALDLKHWLLSHALWVVAVGVAFIGYRSYIAEHDARLLADQKVAVAEQQVKALQTNIDQNNAAIASLQQQMSQRDAQNAQIISKLVAQQKAAVTPSQQVAVLQTTAKLPEPIVSIAGTPDWKLPASDVQPLFQAITDGQIAGTNLAACQSDLTDEKQIEAKDQSTIADQKQQLDLKDTEIATLKKKPGFWHRVSGTLKLVGIGIGIGVGIAGHL